MVIFVVGVLVEIMVVVDVIIVFIGLWFFGGINWVDIDDIIIDYFILVVIYFISSDELLLFDSDVSM